MKFILHLYIHGTGGRSSRAIANFHALCQTHLPADTHYEVIDIASNPEAAIEARIIATPTLIKYAPLPPQRVIGDLSDMERVLYGLGISSIGH
ncbi:MAG: circadian clock KaiB family protein [Chloroflexota bacterium]